PNGPSQPVETQAQPPSDHGVQQLPNDAAGGSDQRLSLLDQAGDGVNVDPVLKQTEARSMEELQKRITRLEQQLHSVARERTIPGGAGLSVAAPRPHLRFQTLAGIQSQPYCNIDEYQAQLAEMVPMITEAINFRTSRKSNELARLHGVMPDLLDTMPPRAVCDQAVEAYLRTFEQIFRILHIPTFRREYDAFWDDPESSPMEFVLKLVLVIAVGGVFLADRARSDEIRGLARSWTYAAQWWIMGPTEREAMNLGGVQVFCLLILTRDVNSLGGATSIATESLLKLAFTIGLHLDPNTFRSLSKLQAELRRRLWITVVEITVLASLDSTLPLSHFLGSFKPKPPTNICDEDLDSGEQPSGSRLSSNGLSTDCSLQLLLAKSLALRIDVVHELNNGHRELSYERALEFGNALTSHCREIAAFFDREGKAGYHDSGRFHRKFLDTYMRRLILFAHRPFCLHSRRDPRFFLARKICLESSLITTEGCAEGEEEDRMSLPPFGPSDDFSRMCVRGSGLFKGGLSSDAISAIGAEIITQIEEEITTTAGSSRTSTASLGSSFGSSAATATASDPLVRLSRRNREPLMRRLEHVHGQLRQVIALGRLSTKRYIFTSGVLAQIRAMEAGEDPKPLIFEALKDGLRECIALFRASAGASSAGVGAPTPAMTDDSNPFSLEGMNWFGFDFSSLDPNFVFDVPDILNSPTLTASDTML
ncbi:hypothetical protein SLS62_000481, partial [Diatrype stigma]